MRRVLIVFAAAIALTTASGSTVNARGADIETFPVSFTLTSTSCALLPAGTTINGTGTERSMTNVLSKHDGTLTFVNATHAFGIARDQNGNTYVFQYSNEFRVSNSIGDPGLFTGLMTDSFSMAGPGPAQLNNGFVADIVTDFGAVFTFAPRQSHGDRINFATGESHCDPL
jgi:hypothetical protein